jgi:hypothetical protein
VPYVPRWIRPLALAAAAVLSAMLGEVTAVAQQAPTPLVVVEGQLVRIEGQGCCTPPGPSAVAYDMGLFVLPGGDVVDVAAPKTINGVAVPGNPQTVWRGPGTAALYGDLRGALASARSGVQSDCHGSDGIAIDLRITWFGRHGRRNAFRVLGLDKSVPECPVEVLRLLETIERFRFQFEQLASTQVLESLPR